MSRLNVNQMRLLYCVYLQTLNLASMQHLGMNELMLPDLIEFLLDKTLICKFFSLKSYLKDNFTNVRKKL